jgi:hypothetical protein
VRGGQSALQQSLPPPGQERLPIIEAVAASWNGINHGVGGSRINYHHGGKRDDGNGRGGGGPNAPFDGRTAKFALECKRRGMRTGHDNLRDLLTGCTLSPAGVGGVAPRNDGVLF